MSLTTLPGQMTLPPSETAHFRSNGRQLRKLPSRRSVARPDSLAVEATEKRITGLIYDKRRRRW
jgi:hypothetical protein